MKFTTFGYVTALVIFLVVPSYASTDYSKSCKTPSTYNGSALTKLNDADQTCDYVYAAFSTSGFAFNSVSWASATCSDFNGNEALLNLIATDCCSDGMSVCAKDYSGACLDASKFSPTATYALAGNTPLTCQAWYDAKSQTGYAFNSIDWNATVSCSTFKTAKDASDGQSPRFLNYLLSEGCCTDGKSACHADFSNMCKTPSTYTPTKKPSSWEGTNTCNMMAAFNSFVSGEALVGTKFSTGLQCSDVSASGKDVIVAISAECCSDGKGICDPKLEENGASSVSMHKLAIIPLFVLHLSSFF
jgi:hypothetical protein